MAAWLALLIVSTSAIVAGVLFASFQIRLARRQRAQEAELLVVTRRNAYR